MSLPERARRVRIATALTLAGALALTACSGDDSGGGEVDEVVIAHAAGVNGEAVEALLDDFTADTGIKATGITMSDTDYGAKLELAARSERADFDVALGIAEDVFAITEESEIYGDLDTTKWDPADLAALEDADLIGPNWVVSQQTAALLVSSNDLET